MRFFSNSTPPVFKIKILYIFCMSFCVLGYLSKAVFAQSSAPVVKEVQKQDPMPQASMKQEVLQPEAAAKPVDAHKDPSPVVAKDTAKTPPSVVSYQQTIPQIPSSRQETDGPVSVYVDRAEVLPLPRNIGSLVIGNPLIADASIHPNGFMVITPKGLGTTNLIVLDTKGQTISNRLIKVKTVSEQTVRVFRGIERETYNCAPYCDKTQTLGDANAFFDANMGQSSSRTNTISGMARQQ